MILTKNTNFVRVSPKIWRGTVLYYIIKYTDFVEQKGNEVFAAHVFELISNNSTLLLASPPTARTVLSILPSVVLK